LKEIVDKFGGFIPLPMIMNSKTVDPKDDSSQKVVQLETAMGAGKFGSVDYAIQVHHFLPF
jgi:hypothetical protein